MSEHSIVTMTADQYRAADGLNFSSLKILSDRSPAHFRAYMSGQSERETTPAMRFGSLVHSCILEPDKADYVVRPEGMVFTTKEGKGWRDSQTKEIVTATEEKTIKSMRDSVYSHPMASRLLCGGRAEQSLFARDSKGVMRKGRLDYLTDSGNVVIDLKTCEDASPDGFGKNVANYSYVKQAYWYLKLAKLCGLKKDAFIFIAVEKTAPYAVACYQVPDDLLEGAGTIIEADVQKFINCRMSNEWPAYGDGIQTLILPSWAEKQLTIN